MPPAIQNAHERGPLKREPITSLARMRSDDSSVEDLAAGEVGVQVDVGRQNEVLVVVFGGFAESNQIGGRGNLVGIVHRTGATAVRARPCGRTQAQDDHENTGWVCLSATSIGCHLCSLQWLSYAF